MPRALACTNGVENRALMSLWASNQATGWILEEVLLPQRSGGGGGGSNNSNSNSNSNNNNNNHKNTRSSAKSRGELEGKLKGSGTFETSKHKIWTDLGCATPAEANSSSREAQHHEYSTCLPHVRSIATCTSRFTVSPPQEKRDTGWQKLPANFKFLKMPTS